MDDYKNISDNIENKEMANRMLNANLSGDTVILVGKCTISYEGRSWKYLEPGVRSVIIKPSGAMVVNSSHRVKPENWQPEGSSITIDTNEDEELIVEALNSGESLQARFLNIIDCIHYEHSDDRNSSVEGKESDIHNHIIKNPEIIENGFTVLEHEKQTEAGDIDIYGVDNESNRVIVEVKRRKATLDSVSQLNRYMESSVQSSRGIVAAPDITDSAERLLSDDGYEFIQIETPKLVT